jgi:hypothetical protein
MNNLNENIEIKVFASGKKQKTYDMQDEEQAVDAIRQHVLPKAEVEYLKVKVKITRKDDSSPKHLTAYLMRKDSYTADVVKIEVDENFQVQAIKENYDDSEDQDEEEEEGVTYAPGESFDFIAATPLPEISSAKQAVEKAHQIAVNAGLKSKILLGTDASVANYKRYLATDIKGFVNVGHGSTNGIILEDGKLNYTWFKGLSGKSLTPCVIYFNSCEVFNDPLQPNIMHAGARTFIGGIKPLWIGPSEEVCKAFWDKSLMGNERMGEALHNSEQSHYPKKDKGAHGISGDLDIFGSVSITEQMEIAVVTLKNKETNRYLFSTGEKSVSSDGSEGDWLKNHPIVGADDNYYGRAKWHLIKTGEFYLLKNRETNRYLYSTGEKSVKDGSEGGWLKSPPVVGADANNYERAKWDMIKTGDFYHLKNKETNRYLFSVGEKSVNDGSEGGWLESPSIVGADDNYYDRGKWHIDGLE